MNEADAEQSAVLLHAEAFGQIERVVISVPGEDAAITEKFGDGSRVVIADSNGYGRTAFGEAGGIRDAERSCAAGSWRRPSSAR